MKLKYWNINLFLFILKDQFKKLKIYLMIQGQVNKLILNLKEVHLKISN